MDKLKECALAYQNLLFTKYKIILGRKNKLSEILLCFDKKEFFHMIGLQKLIDLPYLKKDRGKIFDMIISGKITYSDIAKSSFFYKNENIGTFGIESRIEPLSHLEEILDANNIIFKYNKKNTFSEIDAEYLFETLWEQQIIYIFIDKNNSNDKFCRSFFPKDKIDYTKNQTNMKMLYKEKIINDSIEIQYDKLNKNIGKDATA